MVEDTSVAIIMKIYSFNDFLEKRDSTEAVLISRVCRLVVLSGWLLVFMVYTRKKSCVLLLISQSQLILLVAVQGGLSLHPSCNKACSTPLSFAGFLQIRDSSTAVRLIDEMVGKGFSADSTTFQMLLDLESPDEIISRFMRGSSRGRKMK
ncbi:hypothetical protein NC651_012630 [Populus alba x Populus x berolinensis]|nr:hypothetical protein NC651_012630 [Populus alba x Populus x berolinensis]